MTVVLSCLGPVHNHFHLICSLMFYLYVTFLNANELFCIIVFAWINATKEHEIRLTSVKFYCELTFLKILFISILYLLRYVEFLKFCQLDGIIYYLCNIGSGVWILGCTPPPSVPVKTTSVFNCTPIPSSRYASDLFVGDLCYACVLRKFSLNRTSID